MSSCTKPRNRDSFVRFKSESPKFKDILRKKCQQRWRENRWAFLDKIRNISEAEDETETIRNTLTNVIKEDLKSVCNSRIPVDADQHLRDLEDFEVELQDQNLKWLLDEYDKILDDEDRLAVLLEELNDVFCPICRKNYLSIQNEGFASFVTCVCGIKIQTELNLLQVKENITRCVETHNANCDHEPQFETIHESPGYQVYLLCYTCSSFSVLI